MHHFYRKWIQRINPEGTNILVPLCRLTLQKGPLNFGKTLYFILLYMYILSLEHCPSNLSFFCTKGETKRSFYLDLT